MDSLLPSSRCRAAFGRHARHRQARRHQRRAARRRHPRHARCRVHSAWSGGARNRPKVAENPNDSPGSTIGILGGGQLGRMLAMAAASMGYRVTSSRPRPSFRPTTSPPPTRAAYTVMPRSRLRRRGRCHDRRVRERRRREPRVPRIPRADAPSAQALRIAQDRLAEGFLHRPGGRAASYRAVSSLADPKRPCASRHPSILKTRRSATTARVKFV